MSKQVNAFRDFEYEGWLDDGVCQNYHNYFNGLSEKRFVVK